MTDDDLRAECIKWLMEQGLFDYDEYTQQPRSLDCQSYLNDIIAFAKRRRAAGLREAITVLDGFLDIEWASTDDQVYEFRKECERRAKEYES